MLWGPHGSCQLGQRHNLIFVVLKFLKGWGLTLLLLFFWRYGWRICSYPLGFIAQMGRILDPFSMPHCSLGATCMRRDLLKFWSKKSSSEKVDCVRSGRVIKLWLDSIGKGYIPRMICKHYVYVWPMILFVRNTCWREWEWRKVV